VPALLLHRTLPHPSSLHLQRSRLFAWRAVRLCFTVAQPPRPLASTTVVIVQRKTTAMVVATVMKLPTITTTTTTTQVATLQTLVDQAAARLVPKHALSRKKSLRPSHLSTLARHRSLETSKSRTLAGTMTRVASNESQSRAN